MTMFFRHHNHFHFPTKISFGAYFSNTWGDDICLCHRIPNTLCDEIIVSSLRQIIGDDIFRHHSPIHSPSKISSGTYFSNTLGDAICFRHPVSSIVHEKIFISSLQKLIWWRKMSLPYITNLSDDIVRHHKSHSLSHQKKFVSAYFSSILGDEN